MSGSSPLAFTAVLSSLIKGDLTSVESQLRARCKHLNRKLCVLQNDSESETNHDAVATTLITNNACTDNLPKSTKELVPQTDPLMPSQPDLDGYCNDLVFVQEDAYPLESSRDLEAESNNNNNNLKPASEGDSAEEDEEDMDPSYMHFLDSLLANHNNTNTNSDNDNDIVSLTQTQEEQDKGCEDEAPHVNASSTSASGSGEEDDCCVNFSHLRTLSSVYPSSSSRDACNYFRPSPLQAYILTSINERRKKLGHQFGIMVLATGLGKTVLALLDIESQLERMVQPGASLKTIFAQSSDYNKTTHHQRPASPPAASTSDSNSNSTTTSANNNHKRKRVDQGVLKTLLDMGFQQDECEQALRALKKQSNIITLDNAINAIVSIQKKGGCGVSKKPRRAAERPHQHHIRNSDSDTCSDHFEDNTTATAQGPNNRKHQTVPVNDNNNNNSGSNNSAVEASETLPHHCENDTRAADKTPPFRFLFLVHSKAIRDSAYTKFRDHFTKKFGLRSSSFVSVDNVSPSGLQKAAFIFCLFQSFEKISHLAGTFTHVILDEVHHILAPSYRAVYDTIIAASKDLRYMLGLTATLIHRSDPTGSTLKSMFRDTVYINLQWTRAKELDLFPKVEYLEAFPTLSSGRDIRTYNDILVSSFFRKQDEPPRRLSNMVNSFLSDLDTSLKVLQLFTDEQVKKHVTAEYVVKQFLQYCDTRRQANLPQKTKAIIFAQNCKMADSIQDQLCAKGISAVAVHSRHHSDKTMQDLRQFAMPTSSSNPKMKVLVTINMLTEGYDCSDIDFIIFARVTLSEIVFVQQMGRGLRQNNNKEVCILDLVGNLRRRWRRLRSETTDEHLYILITSFWHVGNFVGQLQ